jgi:hypothetical protein
MSREWIQNCRRIYECTQQVEAPELEGGNMIGFAPRDLFPWALNSLGMRFAFRTQIGYNVMNILRVPVYNTLRLKP